MAALPPAVVAEPPPAELARAAFPAATPTAHPMVAGPAEAYRGHGAAAREAPMTAELAARAHLRADPAGRASRHPAWSLARQRARAQHLSAVASPPPLSSRARRLVPSPPPIRSRRPVPCPVASALDVPIDCFPRRPARAHPTNQNSGPAIACRMGQRSTCLPTISSRWPASRTIGLIRLGLHPFGGNPPAQ